MFNGKKIAAAGLLGGLAMTCIGVGQAHAANTAVCGLDAQGNIICTQQVTGQTPEGDGFVLRRTVNCQPTKPLTLPTAGVLSSGQTRIGPDITCADMNKQAPAPSAQSADQDESSPLISRLLG
ncbi:hypothetical protein SZN_08219 [Streptomyces zinciresistens K42]|uniref:Secreted protein n=1 Tax=Streptomyces zinciresistens K42 TaxID=700597 RepID=G2G830_9ACTN|nr:hypothetical protein [Streptomyces zinciresistens]EGX60318.1 hypothetical protein SZN_08219 [Streptomyces zinciresistens K42]